MKGKRQYYRRITRNFAIIASVLFACLILMEVSFAENIITTREHIVETQMDTVSQEFTVTSSAITNSIYRLLITQELSDYLEAERGTPAYYYDELKLQGVLRESSPFHTNSAYTIGIARDEADSPIVTATGIFPKAYFVESLGLDPVPEILSCSRNISLSKGKETASMLIAKKRDTESGPVLIYISLPLDSVAAGNGDITISLYDSASAKVISRNQAMAEMDFSDHPYLLSREGILKMGKHTIKPMAIPFSDSFLLLSMRDNMSLPLRFTLLASLLILGFLIIMLSARLRQEMYRPIEETVNILSAKKGERPHDEFAFIMENCRKINELHEELETAMDAHRRLKEQQKYRAFLRGLPAEVKPNDRTSWFTLAYTVVNDDVDTPDALFSRIDNAVKEIEHLHSIRINNTHNAYIYKSDEERQSYDILYNTLQMLTFHLDGMDEVRFFITPPERGYEHLPAMFEKADDMLQYRYRIRNKFVLTEEDIPEADELMDYGISDERMLVNAMTADKDEALDIYDGIVKRNFSDSHRLSQKEAIRLSYSMIGTVNRVFHELRETPESLVGHSIDFEELYRSRDIEKVLESVRHILAEILRERQRRNEQEDDRMIVRMKEYINGHYMENLMLIDLSTTYNLTPKYCSTLFKKLSNDTFKNYLNQLRIEKACQKLRDNPRMKIQDLSEEVGFQSSNTFIRAFSRIMGITPGTYAENIQRRS